MNSDFPSPPDPNLSDLGRAMLGGGSGGSGSKPSGPWMPPSAEELARLLPGYEIVSMLGRGGMGAVYMGRQISLDRPVAIKILSGALEDSDLGFKERFKNEARAMAKLSHPGIVAVHDFGETGDGLLYIVMEYVDGTDVSRMIAAEGRLHTEYAMAITAHVCDALAYAHERGIIHRDIKPANIMVGYDGVVKVADFGLAKVHGDGSTLGLTMSGVAMGTMHYIAPEALTSDVPVDHRADLYAVGVMLYQMLTGKLPQGMFELPSMQVPGLDPRYDGIIARAMREDPEDRYPSASDLRADLDAILTQPVPRIEDAHTAAVAALPTRARPQRPGAKAIRARRPVPAKESSRAWIVWVALLVISAGGGAWWWKQKPSGDVSTVPTSASSVGPKTPAPGTPSDPVATGPATERIPAPVPSIPAPSTNPSQANTTPAIPSKAVPSMPAAASVPGSTTGGTASPLAPEAASRLANYQSTRQTQLRDLTEKYRKALVAARDAAPADQAAFDGEIAAVFALFPRIESLASETVVAPLPALPTLVEDAPERLRQLRTIQEAEFSKIESALVGSLDQSLAAVQTTLVQAEKLAEATAVEAFRREIAPLFSTASVAPVPSVAPVASVSDSTASTPFPTPRLVDVRRIWNQAPQNQYTDLIFHNGSWLCVFREAAQHAATSKGSIRVIGSSDGNEWSSLALISDPDLDLRDPKITVSPDGRLMLNSGGKIPRNRNFIQSKVWFSSNGGSNWSAADDVGDEGFWLWRVVPHHHALYSIGYSTPLLNPPRLYRSGDGKNYESFVSALALPQTATEGSLLFRKDGSSIALIRHDAGDRHSFVGTASPPYSSWSWKKLDRQIGGPNLIELPSGHLLVAGRFYEPDQHLAVHWLTLGQNHVDSEECLRLPSKIQTGYPGLVWEKDLLWVSYHSSHEGSPSIYLARVAFTDSNAPSKPVAAASPVNPPDPARPASQSALANLSAATKDRPFVNSLGMKLVPVPGTRVLMCVHETRRQDYETYATANPEANGDWKRSSDHGFQLGDDMNLPVFFVNKGDARAFCLWLSGRENLIYRLPTDREWSVAVGIGDREDEDIPPPDLDKALPGVYPWGSAWPPPDRVGNLADESLTARFPKDEVIPSYMDGFQGPAPVMSFPPNSLGLFDLAGNVWEWTGTVWEGSRGIGGLARGSNWRGSTKSDPESRSLSSHRQVGSPATRSSSGGFRVVLELP